MADSPTNDPAASNTLKLVEEVATIAKRQVATGKVEVRTSTETFEEVVRGALRSEQVEVTRVPIDREVDVAPKIRTEGDLTIVPVLEEVLIVETRLVLKEEIHIRRLVRTDAIETPVTLRRQRAVVERLNSAGTAEPVKSTEKETP